MSLPNYLAKIKSSGTYRFVFDDSTISPQEAAETLRLVCGYSEKGPFNTPVLVETPNDFITIFGNISKRLERRGVYFHRMALQALQAGPILALNLKPFDKEGSTAKEQVNVLKFNVGNIGADLSDGSYLTSVSVTDIYNTNRFWYLDEDKLIDSAKYAQIAATDIKDKSCTIFMRKYTPSGYNLTIRDWYANNSTEEMPEYLEKIQDQNLSDYFAEIFVFRGKFDSNLISGDGSLSNYFSGENINLGYINPYSGNTDALVDLANDPNSNFIGRYQGTTIPYFKDANGRYISLDIVFNKDNYVHNMMMKFNESVLENASSDTIDTILKAGTAVSDTEYYNKLYSVNYSGDTFKISNVNKSTSKPEKTSVLALNGFLVKPNQKLYAVTKNSSVYGYTGVIVSDLYGESGNTVVEQDEAIAVFENNNLTGKIYFNLPSPTNNKSYEEYVEEYLNSGELFDNLVTFSDGKYKRASKDSAITKFAGSSLTIYNGDDYDQSCIKVNEKDDNAISKVYLQGYTYKTIDSSVKEGALVKKILTMLDDKGIRTALTNNVDVNYHYLIDTFRTYTNTTDKTKLFSIAKAKDNCFAIVNFPFMTDMITSGKIDTSLYSMPKEIDGASWGAYFTSLIFSDGAIKETVPSAACVSNNFMDKYGSRLPYDIVAGPKYGRIVMSGLVGPDYKYGRDDLDILEPYGVNAIIYVPRKGTYINSNQTAKQVPVSGLSKIHIRELVTYVQDEIQSLLESYQWDKNTSALRDTIKAKADAILENVKNNDGVYEYNNTCDDTNNTAEVIDNEMIILDTEIEPARGAGKMVNRLTIRRTGGISSTIV